MNERYMSRPTDAKGFAEDAVEILHDHDARLDLLVNSTAQEVDAECQRFHLAMEAAAKKRGVTEPWDEIAEIGDSLGFDGEKGTRLIRQLMAV